MCVKSQLLLLGKSRKLYKMKNKFIGMTLVELLVGLALLSIIVLGLSQIDLFSRSQVLRTDRQAVVENELSLILSHMDKTGLWAIGNERVYGNDTVVRSDTDGNSIDLAVYVDGNKDGKYTSAGGGDYAVAYQLGTNPGAGAGLPKQHHLRYCSQCNSISVCKNNAQCPAWETLGTHISSITNFAISKPNGSKLNNNYVYIEMTACWRPDAPANTPDSCGTLLNPQVTMHTVINFPMVSVN